MENNLDLLNILKDKKVNLRYIYDYIKQGCESQYIAEWYNSFAYCEHLTIDEMNKIVDWLKGE